MIVAVASGKGGTGKTTVATSLALACEGSVRLLDCDVEEPNAGLLLNPHLTIAETVELPVPLFSRDLCTQCGKCVEVCAFNALALAGKELLVFPNLCHGCGSCFYFCQNNALTEDRRRIGLVQQGWAGKIAFSRGLLDVGEALALPVIQEVKKNIGDEEHTVIDSPPGTSCPVIAAVRGADFCVVVTEPTPFGLHDLDAVTALLQTLGIPHGVVINRYDLGDERVDAFCREKGIPVLMRIPFDRRIARSIGRGRPLVAELPEWRERFRQLWRDVERMMWDARNCSTQR
ncbi:MAG: P-loop NTPase [Peptococcaceae bacterium]|nr:P-loop NTPase [Peptococcaceae bacterium]